MDATLLEVLLRKSESETLDFKQQYEFYGANDQVKSELLKDILAFANAWKDTDAHIVIGACEKDQRVDSLCGVASHLADNDLQQFVNWKTNRAITFGVEAVTYKGSELDVIRIARSQSRPIFCIKDFGSVAKEHVYIRRGSSTSLADPDEISAFGRSESGSLVHVPTIEFEFADVEQRQRLGLSHSVLSTTLTQASPKPQTASIAPIGSIIPRGLLTNTAVFNDPLAPTFADWVNYLKQSKFLVPVGFWIRNSGRVTITNANVEIHLPRAEGLVVRRGQDAPVPPQYGFKTIFTSLNNQVSVREHVVGFTVGFQFDRIQAKAQLWSPGAFYVGSEATAELQCAASFFADNLSDPICFELKLKVRAERGEYAANDIRRLRERNKRN